jgi:hypothetical protein
MNPYQSHNEVDRDGSEPDALSVRSPIRSSLAYSVWGIGTFLFSLIILFDSLTGAKLPGVMMFVAVVLGPTLGVCGAMATNHRLVGKIFLIITTLCLLPLQFVFVGIVLLLMDGLEGIQ